MAFQVTHPPRSAEELLSIIARLESRQARRQSQCITVEGWRCAREALRFHSELAIGMLIANDQKSVDDTLTIPAHLPCFRVERYRLEKYSTTDHPPGVLLVMRTPPILVQQVPSFSSWFTPVLDGVSDPGNIGTMLRTFWAVGVREVVLLPGCCHPYNPKAIRGGMGAQFALQLYVAKDVEECCVWAKGRPIWVTHPHRGQDFSNPLCQIDQSLVVFGNEAHGVCPEWNLKVNLGLAEYLYIPMPGGTESLNVAQVATLISCVGLWRKNFKG